RGHNGANNGSGNGPGGNGNTPVDPGNPSAGQPLPEGTSLGKPGLRRLSRREYENSIRDAFGLGTEWKGPQLTADRASAIGFDNDVSLLEIDDARSGELTTNAEAVADVVLANGKLGSVPACKTMGKDCVGGVVDTIGTRLFRRAVSDAEKGRYLGVYDQV